jgi:hypothetical protein
MGAHVGPNGAFNDQRAGFRERFLTG